MNFLELFSDAGGLAKVLELAGFKYAALVENNKDEILSVGDKSFKNKYQHRIDKFLNGETTILIVYHDLGFIRSSCNRVVWLGRGRIKYIGSGPDTVDRYLDTVIA